LEILVTFGPKIRFNDFDARHLDFCTRINNDLNKFEAVDRIIVRYIWLKFGSILGSNFFSLLFFFFFFFFAKTTGMKNAVFWDVVADCSHRLMLVSRSRIFLP
jgi:hypothetical protein